MMRSLRSLIPQDEVDMSRAEPSNKRNVVKEAAAPLDAAAVRRFLDEYAERGAKLKVAELKAGLKTLGLPTSGTKPELLARAKMFTLLEEEREAGGEGSKRVKKVHKMELYDGEGDAAVLSRPKKKQKHVLTLDDDED